MSDVEARLIQEKLVNPMDLLAAKRDAERSGKSIWSALVKLKYLSEEDIAVFFASLSAIAYVKISDYTIDPEVLAMADENFCRENLIIPMFKVRNTLFVACANPLDTRLIDSLSQMCNLDIESLLASANSILSALNNYFGPPQKDFEMEKFVFKKGTVKGLGFWRESERIPLEIPARITIAEPAVALSNPSAIECSTIDISRNGSAIGVLVSLFLPKAIYISMEFNLGGKDVAEHKIVKAKGEIVHSHMEKGGRYFLGIKFIEIDKNEVQELIKLAESK